MTRTMKTAWALAFSFQEFFVVLNVTCVGPEPTQAELQTPTGTLETLVRTTVNPAGRMSATQPIGPLPSVTVTVTSVGTPSVRTLGEKAMLQASPTALTAAGLPGTAAAANPTSASASARAVLRVAIRRPGDPAA